MRRDESGTVPAPPRGGDLVGSYVVTPARISVIGCGYLGAVHAACMADLGHDVVGIDVDADKVAALTAGRAPFFEPGFPEVLGRALAGGRLRFSTSYADAADADVHFLCLGTPQRSGSHAADTSYLDAAVDALARC